jgi:hypothetical protein
MKWNPKRNAWLLIPGVMLGIGFGSFLNGYWLIDKFPIDSRQLLFFTLAATLLGIAGYTMLLGWMRDRLAATTSSQKLGLIASAVLIGTILFFAGTDQWQTKPKYVTVLLPTHRLEISVPPAQPAGDIALIWFNTSLGDVSFDAINYKGWKREGDELVLQDPSNNMLTWSGKPGEEVQLVLRSSARDGEAVISWDGQDETLRLTSEKNSYSHAFDIPSYATRPLILGLGIFNFILLSFAAFLFLWEKREMLYESLSQSFVRTTARWDVKETAILLGVIILALSLRVFNLGNLFPAVDEYYQLIAAKQIIAGAALSSVYQRSLWLVTLPVTLALRIFGNQLWAARMVGVLFNVLAIIPLYLLMRKINRPIAVLSSLLYATSPWIITFARVVREYAFYPFYFYWIILGMVVFIEGIPTGFVFLRDWKIFFKPRMGSLGLALIIPPIFGFYIDRLSTFTVILLAYLVFGSFILLKFNLRDKRNLPVLVLISGGILIAGTKVLERHNGLLSLLPKFNPFPLQYFFPNAQQQWYFDRFVIIPVIGLLCSLLACFLIRRVNFIPVFLLSLFAVFLGFFLFISKNFYHTRHLSTTELWYILLTGIGLYIVWSLLHTLIPFKGSAVKIGSVIILGIMVMNPQQILLPVTSNNPDMPISEDYYHNMSLIQGYMVQHAQNNEVLVSTVYGLYATWQGEPGFQRIYRITSQTPKQDVFALVDQNPSGWLVIDQIRLDQADMTIKDYSGKDEIEYMGLFGDEYVWHWQHPSANTIVPWVLGKGQ